MQQLIAVLTKHSQLLGFFNIASGAVSFESIEEELEQSFSDIKNQIQAGPLEFRREVSNEQSTEYRLISSEVSPGSPDYSGAIVQVLEKYGYETGVVTEQLREPLTVLNQADIPTEERLVLFRSLFTLNPEDTQEFLQELSKLTELLKQLE